jgi:hypothetical protein
VANIYHHFPLIDMKLHFSFLSFSKTNKVDILLSLLFDPKTREPKKLFSLTLGLSHHSNKIETQGHEGVVQTDQQDKDDGGAGWSASSNIGKVNVQLGTILFGKSMERTVDLWWPAHLGR